MTTYSIGCNRGMPAADYHAVEAASATALREIHTKSLHHYKLSLAKPRKPTWQMMFGTIAHQAILEPSLPLSGIVVAPTHYVVPEGAKPTKDGPKPGDTIEWSWKRKYCQDWGKEAEAKGLIVVEKSDLDAINYAVESIAKCQAARELLEGAEAELTCLWQDNDGYRCKARIDAIPRVPGVIADLKTCQDASPEGFQRHAWNMAYHIQAGWYQIAWEQCGDGDRNEFKFIAVELESGAVKVHRCSRSFLDRGRIDAMAAYKLYKKAISTDQWPAYGDDECELDVPYYAWEGYR